MPKLAWWLLSERIQTVKACMAYRSFQGLDCSVRCEEVTKGWLACGSQAFIPALLFEPTMSPKVVPQTVRRIALNIFLTNKIGRTKKLITILGTVKGQTFRKHLSGIRPRKCSWDNRVDFFLSGKLHRLSPFPPDTS